VQLTCAIVGKGQRLATLTTSEPYLKRHQAALSEWTESGRFQVSSRLELPRGY
jgi:hypothetical protein